MVIAMYKILLVEDDKNIREMVVEYFSNKGKGNFPVSVAANGEIGLQMAYENPYDLLLLDVNLPKMDGFSICKEVRRYSDVPIMFITARVNEEDVLNEPYSAICPNSRACMMISPSTAFCGIWRL